MQISRLILYVFQICKKCLVRPDSMCSILRHMKDPFVFDIYPVWVDQKNYEKQNNVQTQIKDFQHDKVNIAWCSMGYGKLFTLEKNYSTRLAPRGIIFSRVNNFPYPMEHHAIFTYYNIQQCYSKPFMLSLLLIYFKFYSQICDPTPHYFQHKMV